ncbi:MAG: hypothetical protein JO256_14125 [Alphaproteobacteria bacterium]|nr:hypothetical protein [Alphaproteobacteria bacterium]
MAHTYMPIMHNQSSVATLPWSIFTGLDEEQAIKNHSQTLGELAGRGGLSICELVAVLDHRPWREMKWVLAWSRLWQIVAERRASLQPST